MVHRDYSLAGIARLIVRARQSVGSRLRLACYSAQYPNLVVVRRVRISANVDIRLGRDSRVTLADCWLSPGVVLHTGPGACLSIEAAFIGHGSVIVARDSIFIGTGTEIAEHVTIRDASHDHRWPLRAQKYKVEPVVIGREVWIGAKATVLPGVSIGDGATVGAGAVVTRDVPASATVVGVPARVVE